MNTRNSTECEHPGCGRAKGSRLYCTTHWRRSKAGKDMDAPIQEYGRNRTCSKCGEPTHARGLCTYHYNHRNRGDKPVREYAQEGCKVPGCENTHYSLGLCNRHSQRRRNYNLTVDQLLKTYTEPCSICGAPPVTDLSKRVHHIDHDHACCPETARSCGKCVRGVLCSRCNTGIGNFRDDPGLLSEAIRYLGESRT